MKCPTIGSIFSDLAINTLMLLLAFLMAFCLMFNKGIFIFDLIYFIFTILLSTVFVIDSIKIGYKIEKYLIDHKVLCEINEERKDNVI